MDASFNTYVELVQDGERNDMPTYGVRAVAEVTFRQPEGPNIVGTRIVSPGVWDVEMLPIDVISNEYVQEIALEELATLAEMIKARGVQTFALPDEVRYEVAAMREP